MTTVLRNPKALVGLACLLFLLQTVPLFSFRWVEDESFYSSTAHTLLVDGQVRNTFLGPNHPQIYDPRPLAMPVTLAAAFGAFGVSVASARLPELLVCLASIPLVFWLGIQLASREAGALAALMLSVDNALFLGGRTVRPEAFVTFFGLLAVALFVFSKSRKSLGLAALSGLALGLSLNYHVNGYCIALSIGLLLLGEYGLSVWRQKRAWVIVLVSIATLAPFVLWLRADPGHMVAFREL